MALLFTFITGVFFLLGIILNHTLKDNKNISVLSISLAFVVLLNLIIFDLVPETFTDITYKRIMWIILGFSILKIMDLFVPHHHHDHHHEEDDVKEHNFHLEHISIITILALSLHNIIECMALYNVTEGSIKSGLLMGIAIALHNIPLGFQIGGSLKNYKYLYVSTLVLSGFVGGLISLAIGAIPEIYTIYILCFTLGMLLYLTFFELLKELIHGIKNFYTIYGIIIGIVLIIITNML